MATLKVVNGSYNQNSASLYNINYGFYQDYYYVNEVFNGVFYPDVLEYDFLGAGNKSYAGIFGGNFNVGYSSYGTQIPISGNVTAYLELALSRASYKVLFYLQDINVSAYYLYNASETFDKSDDDVMFSIALSGNDNLIGAAKNDVLFGFGGDDYLYGNAGNDVLNGGDGADNLIGGKGKDTLIGGDSDDVYYIDSAGDFISENFNEGFDAVISTTSFSLGANIENLTLTGKAKINGLGNELNNTLIGNTGINTLNGREGDDSLDGSLGADKIIGGVGDDQLGGGLGADTFVWGLSDKGSYGVSSHDIITDFSIAQKDKLDLRDLLEGESKKNINGLLNFLDISTDGVNTEISISSNGGFSAGIYDASQENAHISLLNINLLNGLSEDQLISNLIKSKLLITN